MIDHFIAFMTNDMNQKPNLKPRNDPKTAKLQSFFAEARLVLSDPTWHCPPRCERATWIYVSIGVSIVLKKLGRSWKPKMKCELNAGETWWNMVKHGETYSTELETIPSWIWDRISVAIPAVWHHYEVIRVDWLRHIWVTRKVSAANGFFDILYICMCIYIYIQYKHVFGFSLFSTVLPHPCMLFVSNDFCVEQLEVDGLSAKKKTTLTQEKLSPKKWCWWILMNIARPLKCCSSSCCTCIMLSRYHHVIFSPTVVGPNKTVDDDVRFSGWKVPVPGPTICSCAKPWRSCGGTLSCQVRCAAAVWGKTWIHATWLLGEAVTTHFAKHRRHIHGSECGSSMYVFLERYCTDPDGFWVFFFRLFQLNKGINKSPTTTWLITIQTPSQVPTSRSCSMALRWKLQNRCKWMPRRQKKPKLSWFVTHFSSVSEVDLSKLFWWHFGEFFWSFLKSGLHKALRETAGAWYGGLPTSCASTWLWGRLSILWPRPDFSSSFPVVSKIFFLDIRRAFLTTLVRFEFPGGIFFRSFLGGHHGPGFLAHEQATEAGYNQERVSPQGKGRDMKQQSTSQKSPKICFFTEWFIRKKSQNWLFLYRFSNKVVTSTGELGCPLGSLGVQGGAGQVRLQNL